MALRIRKGDKVVVLSGRDKGKRGEVLGVFPREGRALVQGVNMVKRASKADARGGGGIQAKESKIHLSNIALEDPGGKGSTRFAVQLEDGRKRRQAKRSKEYIDV
ncbi:MAG: 50S ribosomal protein L24 [Hyphomicrobiales bacterium]|nr:50S ribosomal protein L24 [Hyphomicrobiales bacterium]